MVLSRTFVLTALLLSAACVHPVPRPRLANASPIVVAFVIDADPGVRANELPASLRDAVGAELAQHGFIPRFISPQAQDQAFARSRGTEARLEQLARHADGQILLLVELRPQFFSQLSGRFRWTVAVKLSLERAGAPTATREAELPAFLQFSHEREEAALQEIAPRIAEELGSLLSSSLPVEEPAAGEGVDDRATSRTGDAGRANARGDAIYFVLVDRFANGDPTNDLQVDPTDPAGWHGGDLEGLRQRLDELQRLGVGTIWLSPISRARASKVGEHGAFHGYWVEELGEVDPRFGDLATLRRLSDELHARGMKLLLDLVVNHVGPNTELTRSHPSWFHGNGDIVDWSDEAQLLTHDVHGLPDLNQSNEEVHRHLLDAALHFVREVRPDGFRLDAVKHVPLSYWRRFNAELHAAAGPEFLLLGELFDGDPAKLARARREGGFDALFDFPTYYALRDVFCRGASPLRLAAALFADRFYDDPGSLVTFADNHDLPRVLTACGEDVERVASLLRVQLALRGRPSLTYGTEAGLTGAREPENRADMRFAPHPLREVVTESMALRRQHEALRSGATQLLTAEPERLIFARILPDEAVIVAIHRGRAPVSFELPLSLRGEARDLRSGIRLPPGPLRLARDEVTIVQLTPFSRGGFAAAARAAREAPRQSSTEVEVTGVPLADGERVVLVGAGPSLGSWRPEAGAMLERRGDRLGAKVLLPRGGPIPCKLAILRADRTVSWQSGDDRYLVAGTPAKLAWRTEAPP